MVYSMAYTTYLWQSHGIYQGHVAQPWYANLLAYAYKPEPYYGSIFRIIVFVVVVVVVMVEMVVVVVVVVFVVVVVPVAVVVLASAAEDQVAVLVG